MSERVILLHKPWVTASGSHLGYVTFPWDGQKYLEVNTTMTVNGFLHMKYQIPGTGYQHYI